MSKINWVPDCAGLVVLKDIGIDCYEATISVDEIDRKKSKENRARKVPLDTSRIDGISSAMKKNVPIPMIVVRAVGGGKYVIAGGNHRFASIGDVKEIDVHVMVCTDAEFEIACSALNTVVGEGMSRAERIEKAAMAAERLGVSKSTAAAIYGVGLSSVKACLNYHAVKRKVASLPSNVSRQLTQTHVNRLGDLAHNDNVLRAAATLIAETKMSSTALAEVAAIARTKSTEAAQVAVFEERVSQMNERSVVPKKRRKKLLTALSSIQTFTGCKTWESVEVQGEEIQAFKKQAKDVMNILNCLLKANG